MTQFLHLIVRHEKFKLVSGEGALGSYRFGTGAAEHLFCTSCGIKSFYQPRSHPGSWSVNANCLDGRVALSIEEFDGRNWEQSAAAIKQ